MSDTESSQGTSESPINGIQANASDAMRAVNIDLFIGEEWQRNIPLHRTQALELHGDLEGAIRTFWPHALPPVATTERMGALVDALEAALTLLEVHLEHCVSPADDERRTQTESLLEEMRAALNAGDAFEALRDIRELHMERAIRGSSYEEVVQVALDALRLAGRPR